MKIPYLSRLLEIKERQLKYEEEKILLLKKIERGLKNGKIHTKRNRE